MSAAAAVAAAVAAAAVSAAATAASATPATAGAVTTAVTTAAAIATDRRVSSPRSPAVRDVHHSPEPAGAIRVWAAISQPESYSGSGRREISAAYPQEFRRISIRVPAHIHSLSVLRTPSRIPPHTSQSFPAYPSNDPFASIPPRIDVPLASFARVPIGVPPHTNQSYAACTSRRVGVSLGSLVFTT